MTTTKQGDTVRMHYTGRVSGGEVFDTSEGRDPVEFVAGEGQVIPGVDDAVVGMEPGETKTVTVPPEAGYGPRHEDLRQRVPRDAVPEEAAVGSPLQAKVGEDTVVLWVTELGDAEAVLDANHPLAGHTLEFDLHVVDVVTA